MRGTDEYALHHYQTEHEHHDYAHGRDKVLAQESAQHAIVNTGFLYRQVTGVLHMTLALLASGFDRILFIVHMQRRQEHHRQKDRQQYPRRYFLFAFQLHCAAKIDTFLYLCNKN